MRITSEQKKILDDFICERLSADVSNKALINTFVSKRGSSLVNYFKKFGLKEEQDGKTAYYVIKTKQNEMLMFFSMKCGALFDALLDENEVQKDCQRLTILLQAIENADGVDIRADEVNEILTKYQISDKISIEDIANIVAKRKWKKKLLTQLADDKRTEDNNKILRVLSTQSAIELVHFCTNDNMKSKWNTYNMGHPMGETLFWKFIAPKFFEVQSIVGGEYAFLFAADLSEEGSLVNYYDVSLKFQKRLDIGTNKPFYDFCCDFMCQKINDMRKNRQLFFENFNIDKDDIIA